MGEQRRIGFTLPVEVYEQLLDEVIYQDESEGILTFWGLLQEYYQLSFIQGDTVICHPSFSQFIEKEIGEDKPSWVFEQGSLQKMQCIILGGPGRGQVMMDMLKEIEAQRDEAEREVKEEHKLRNEQLGKMFSDNLDGEREKE